MARWGGVRLDPATRYVLRENRRTRRHNQRIARQRRRRLRDQKLRPVSPAHDKPDKHRVES
jgi:hypothetical protein